MVALVAEIHDMPQSEFPDVNEDWSAFMRFVSQLVAKEEMVWCPVSEKKKAWIDLDKLLKYYKP